MPADQQAPAGSLEASADTAGRLHRRSLCNLLRMGHCAPTVMQTVLDVAGVDVPWLVKLTAGLPGGIGNTGGECGGVTAPIVLLGLRHAHDASSDGLPTVIERGHAFVQRFTAWQGTSSCRIIRGDDRLPIRCVGVIRHAPVLYAQTLSDDPVSALSGERRTAIAHLCTHWAERQFHCAHAVVRRLEGTVPVTQELLDATSGFVGGTLCTGMTCSAFTAGVMALGLALGEIEHRRIHVLRMIGTMAAGGDASADRLNAFNVIMNLGHGLSRWCADVFGSTECRTLTQCDFGTPAGVDRYIGADGVTRCETIAARVAQEVARTIARVRADRASAVRTSPAPRTGSASRPLPP